MEELRGAETLRSYEEINEKIRKGDALVMTAEEFVEFVAKHLVDRPEAAFVDVEEKEDKTIFKLRVEQSDVGKLIGKKGRTASAFRVLLRAVAAKEGKKAVLDIIG